MKKVVTVLLLLVISFSAFAQNAIKFLGIPVDGTKKEMISKLEEKGYAYDSQADVLTGEFNGTNVFIMVQTVNNRVWRIAILDANDTDEANIKIRFNTLFEQFTNNSKYKKVDGTKLKDSDNISYEMLVNKKRYDAIFSPKDDSINGVVWYAINSQYGKYQIIMFYENTANAANGDDL